MIIKRDFNRTEHDDYVLHVQPHLERDPLKESVRVYAPDEKDASGNVLNTTKVCLSWKIQNKYE